MTGQCVLLVGRDRDGEFTAVASMLRRAGLPVQRVAFPQLAAGQVRLEPARGVVWLGQRLVRPTVAWTRHPPRPTTSRDRPAAWSAEAAFAEESRVALARQLGETAPVAFPGPAPELLPQLAQAARRGVRVPETVVADQPAAVPGSWRRVVIKALDRHFVTDPAGSLAWFHPVIWDRSGPPSWPPGGPAVLQEYVEHQAEYRIYLAGEEVCAFQVSKRLPADLWLAPDRVTVRVATAPPAVLRAAAELAQHWGLRYAAFDFLVDRGEPVFLEANPDGDWRWFEARAGRPVVTMLAARALADLHRAHRRPPDPDQADRVDPVSFLAA